MPCIKNLATGETHMVTTSMWDLVWKNIVTKEPDKFQHVLSPIMGFTEEDVKYVEDLYSAPEPVKPASLVDISQFIKKEEVKPVVVEEKKVVADTAPVSLTTDEVVENAPKKPGRPVKLR